MTNAKSGDLVAMRVYVAVPTTKLNKSMWLCLEDGMHSIFGIGTLVHFPYETCFTWGIVLLRKCFLMSSTQFNLGFISKFQFSMSDEAWLVYKSLQRIIYLNSRPCKGLYIQLRSLKTSIVLLVSKHTTTF